MTPVEAYLARLAPGSRRAQEGALRILVRVVQGLEGPSRTDDRGRVVSTQIPPSLITKRGVPSSHIPIGGGTWDDPWCASKGTSTLVVAGPALQRALLERYAPATAQRVMAAYRGVVREAWRQGRLSRDEADRALDLPPVRGSRLAAGRALEPAEVASLRDVAGPRDRALLAVLLAGGLRRAEAASLTMDDVTIGVGSPRSCESPPERPDPPAPPPPCTLRVVGKGDKERLVLLAGSWSSDLLSWAVGRGGGSIFGLTGHGVWKAVRRLARRAGVQSLSPHDLRRTHASMMLDRGVDLVTVQRMMGHADPRTTARYDRRDERALQRAAEAMARP